MCATFESDYMNNITPPENEYTDDEMEQMESEAYEMKLNQLLDK